MLDDIDRQAEAEANALQKQGQGKSKQNKRVLQQKEYNREKFEKLFAK